LPVSPGRDFLKGGPMTTPQVRKGQAPETLSREAFGERFRQRFYDPAFEAEREALARVEQIAWEAYDGGRKAPRTVKAGAAFADPGHDLSVEWLETHQRLKAAQQAWADPATGSRVLLVNASTRNDGTCPGEVSKTWRLTSIASDTLRALGIETDLLDLSLLASDYARQIHPCKACVSTAMPLCHWPCSCYPNHGQGQTNDWIVLVDAGPLARLDRFIGYCEP
jgi:hypothetical protein